MKMFSLLWQGSKPAIVFVLFSITLCSSLNPFQPEEISTERNPRNAAPVASNATEDNLKDIVLVHGFNSNSGVWSTLSEYFTALGYNVHKFDYRSTTWERVPKNSERLRQYMEKERLDLANTIYIGHSMGGLVIREMIRQNNVNFKKLVTLATPHYGALWGGPAPIFDKGAILDMLPGSSFLNRLNKEIGKYNENNVLTYHIDHDEVVPPTSSVITNSLYLAVNSQAVFLNSNENDSNDSNDSNECYINDEEAHFTDTGFITCTTSQNTCTFSVDICFIDDQQGILDNDTCTVNNTVCKLSNYAIIGGVHSSIMKKHEVHRNVLKFLQNKVKILDSGPYLRDADCALRLWGHSTVRWDLPRNAPNTLQMNVISYQKNHFDNGNANEQKRDYLSKKVYNLRFYDPVTTTLTKWSSVKFENKKFKCVSTITNNKKITTEWV